MKLHDATVQVLNDEKRSMSTKEITAKLNELKIYSKKDKSEITDFQIHGRTRKYPLLFNRDGTMVSLAQLI